MYMQPYNCLNQVSQKKYISINAMQKSSKSTNMMQVYKIGKKVFYTLSISVWFKNIYFLLNDWETHIFKNKHLSLLYLNNIGIMQEHQRHKKGA